jgi:hypothetical protein
MCDEICNEQTTHQLVHSVVDPLESFAVELACCEEVLSLGLFAKRYWNILLRGDVGITCCKEILELFVKSCWNALCGER